MPKPFLSFYCVVLLVQVTYTTDYCKICKDKSHTMCKYKSGPAKSCAKYSSDEMTPKIQSAIVNLHNALRNKIASGSETRGKLGFQPAAANMLLMKWDNELSRIAQRWADQCVPTKEKNHHDECKNTERFQVGQNVIQAIRGTKPFSFEIMLREMILKWYNEVDRVDPKEVDMFQGADEAAEEFGHYAQLVWATSQFVGCAHVSFSEDIKQKDQTIKATIDTLVCNYGPTGNVVDASIYKIGKPCSECTCSKEYSALCEGDENKWNTENAQKLEAISELIALANNLPEYAKAVHLPTAGTEAVPRSPHEEYHEHHHHKGGKCPFESYRIQYQFLHQEGDECYCLFRTNNVAIIVSGKSYLLCMLYLVLYYFFINRVYL